MPPFVCQHVGWSVCPWKKCQKLSKLKNLPYVQQKTKVIDPVIYTPNIHLDLGLDIFQ